MARRWRLMTQVALVGALGLAFPSASSALCLQTINLTANGPSPTVQTLPAGMPLLWLNSDQVTHTVVFANGLCSLQLAPKTSGQCPHAFKAGQYPYTVDGTIQASIVVNAPPPPTVTLTAKGHRLQKAASLSLHGTLGSTEVCGFPHSPHSSLSVPIAVLARPDRRHPFRHVATVRREAGTPDGGWFWRLNVHPTAKTIYIAKVTYLGEQGQQRAWSRPFKVLVRR